MKEPGATALLLAVLALLLAASVLLSRFAGRLRVPVALLFLVLGMLAGHEGVGHIYFADYELTIRLGVIALVLILFDGGLNTPMAAVKRTALPGVVLATLGVLATAALVAVTAHLLGLDWTTALLVGAVVSSTDAAAVFAVLRSSGIALVRRVATTLELESGLNDPLAVILTLGLIQAMKGEGRIGPHLAWEVLVQLVVGLAGGLLFGFLGRFLLRRARPSALGLLPVLTVALASGAFGVTTLLDGSGFLATYIAAIVLGNGGLPYRTGLLRVHDALAWISQVLMFLVLGLLVTPSQLLAVAPIGLLLALILTFVLRPLAVGLCLAPLGYSVREILFVGWIGLRGAVPIILATFPILADIPGAAHIFNIVFFLVVVNTLIPGSTLGFATKLLGVRAAVPPPSSAVVEIASTHPLESDVLSYYITPASAVAGARLAELPLPNEAAVMLIVRGDRLLPARGDTVIQPHDHVYVFCRPDDRPTVDLLFGRAD